MLGHSTGWPHFIMVRFVVLHRYCMFYKLKVCGNPVSIKSISTILPTAFGDFMSRCYILAILTIFQTFSLLYLIGDLCVFLLYWLWQPLTVWITVNCGKFWKRWEYQTTWSASWEICMRVRKQQLKLDM